MPSAIIDPADIRVTKFTNCFLVKGDRLVYEDLWIDATTGKILKSQEAFYGSLVTPDQTIDLQGKIVAPGFIDVQLNGAAGFNFSVPQETPEEFEAGLKKVNQHLIENGVTSYLPTVVSSLREVYHKVLPHLGPSGASRNPSNGAESLGAHVEGPFLSPSKNGIHSLDVLRVARSLSDVEEMYGKENLYPKASSKSTTATGPTTLSPARIRKITAAPELGAMSDLIPDLTSQNLIFSIGHTSATYDQALHAITQGATMITHLFNAMLPFGHRDPGIFGLLGNKSQPSSPHSSLPSSPSPRASHSSSTPSPEIFRPFFGLIADGIHLHPTTLSLAHSSHPTGTILVTDAMPLSGLPDGLYPYPNNDTLRKSGIYLTLERNGRIAGSAVSLIQCVNNFRRWTRVGVAEAVACVTRTPARMLGAEIEATKGRLEGGMDADLVVLSDSGIEVEEGLRVEGVWKFGREVFRR
ncbi:putative n-acetylglucosamine-6-phosphate deacetylase [Phaeomoniella chlamydospora]|uniref:Putative n-acetylglucosamine-6-phosphate deacetylase n=1 Tax=Phaeomoniella chlamydospora TaxID=158046 RepID=A0A0G2E643_PHACM|nr:putative n-acetylglucosamine-6-phosphate deacetylase [Phaeomoniella chlamydospora]